MRTKKIATLLVGLALLAPATVQAQAGKNGPHGFIYGTIETRGENTYKGLLRWGTEEAFWDDLFNSTKGELPYLEKHGSEKKRRNRIKVFGVTVGYRWDDDSSSRMFVARFGDIQQIVVQRGERVDVMMKDGTIYEMEGGSNDIGATITVQDESLGEVKIDWKRIDRILFESTPSRVKPAAHRLYGTVDTEEGPFEGFIQWDLQECLSTDKLDGETDDGDVAIDMGKIRVIEKRNSRGSRIELFDGRKLVLEGTNDVDDSLRGIYVEDPRYGRVEISWDAFERVEFKQVGSSGRGYDDYDKPRRLAGTVTDYDNGKHTGQIVFDLDEEFDWELLNGSLGDIDFFTPFGMIRSIEPQRDDSAKVVLRGGETVELADGQDVSDRNDGVVVIRTDGRKTYLRWDEVRKIDFK